MIVMKAKMVVQKSYRLSVKLRYGWCHCKSERLLEDFIKMVLKYQGRCDLRLLDGELTDLLCKCLPYISVEFLVRI